MPRARSCAVAALCLIVSFSRVPAQESTPPPTPQQLAAQERVRPIVGAIWQEVRSPARPDEPRPRFFWEVTDKLIAIGPDVVPFLTSELDLMDPETFHFSAYALGRLGGTEAEAALRKAIRVAISRGGRFGLACRRFGLYSLAILGAPDVVELMHQGEPSMHGAIMVPDYPFPAHLGLIVGSDAAPLLEKQIDAWKNEPSATDKLEDTLMALGRTGAASAVPKLVPLLQHASPKIRALAADGISRLAEPSMCAQVMPLLASKDLAERSFVAASLARWKPEPCYKGIVGRLEVEDDVAVRASLYSAVVAMGGESALDVLRAFIRTPNQFDQAIVVDAIGKIGSKKGLELLRSLLTDANANTIAHALQAMATIGGEGAIDTILATTSDRRPFVASAAAELLTSLGDRRVAPRRASELLTLTKDPIGNLTLRARVAELSEALVTLRYTEPIDDLKAAAAVQTDVEITESLNGSIRRLTALKKNGNNDAAWAAELGSPDASIRALAYIRLAELGSPAAVKALAARLAKTDLPADERAAVLRAIGDAKTPGTAALVERHLAEPAFDAWEQRWVRASAAFAARRLGGASMSQALRTSAMRRDGRDWAVLVYWAILDKSAALPALQTLRVRRMRYPESPFGRQDLDLEHILADLAAGHAPASFDLAPGELVED